MDAIKLLRGLVNHYLKEYNTINVACRKVSHGLKNEWAWKYIFHIYSGKATPSSKLKKAIIKLHKKTFTKYPRHRLYIQARSKEEKAGWMELTMRERRDALNEKRAEKRSIG